MKFLNEKGLALVRENFENELPIMEFALGLCGFFTRHDISYLGRCCKKYVELGNIRADLMYEDSKNLLKAQDALYDDMKSNAMFDSCKSLVHSMTNGIASKQGVTGWVLNVDNLLPELFSKSMVLNIFYALPSRMKMFSFTDPKTGIVYKPADLLCFDPDLPPCNYSTIHLELWIVELICEIREKHMVGNTVI